MISIHLLNELPFWQPGDWLEGVVTLDWRKSSSVHGVQLELNGKEHTHWSEPEGKTNAQLFIGEVQWVGSVLALWGFPHLSDHKKELLAGRYVWPFRIAIPDAEQLPASIEDFGFGFVRYQSEFKAYVELSDDISENIECMRMLHWRHKSFRAIQYQSTCI